MGGICDVRHKCMNLPWHVLDHMLDPNKDGTVTVDEFLEFLQKCHLEIPPWQACLLYITMGAQFGQGNISTDNVLLCVAVMSRGIRPVNELADHVSSKIC